MPDLMDDDVQKKSDGLLEQLGLHPSQIHARSSLGLEHPFGKMLMDASAGRELPGVGSGGGASDKPVDNTGVNAPLPKEAAPTESTTPQPVTPKLIGGPAPVESKPPETKMTIPGPTGKSDLITQGTQNKVLDAQKEQDRLIKTGSGISQIKNPFLKAIARVGDVAGTALFPSVTANIPGTELHHRVLEHRAADRVNTGIAEQKEEATTRKTVAEADNAGTEDVGKTPSERTLHDLMTGGPNGGPKTNPDTNKPFTYLEAYTKIKEADQSVKPEKDPPLGDKVPQFNSILQSRWHILHPQETLPPQYSLNDKATHKDYDRVDKALEQEEKAHGTKVQRDLLEEQKRQARELAANNAKERQEKTDMTAVVGLDEEGREVMVSEGEAKKRGLTDVTKLDTQDVGKARAARHWIPLADREDEAHPGILQLIDRLEKKNKLGVIATRWQDFLAGKVGAADDPDFVRLRTKLGLATTLLMNVHVGSRGGSYLMEHFEDLANAKKLNAKTMRAAVEEELDYAKGRAMLPSDIEGGMSSSVKDEKTRAKARGGEEPDEEGSTVHYKEGNDEWKIPEDKVKDFLKKHPGAKEVKGGE